MRQTSLVKTVFRPDVVFRGIPRYVCGRGLCQLCVCVGFLVVYVCGASFCQLGPEVFVCVFANLRLQFFCACVWNRLFFVSGWKSACRCGPSVSARGWGP